MAMFSPVWGNLWVTWANLGQWFQSQVPGDGPRPGEVHRLFPALQGSPSRNPKPLCVLWRQRGLYMWSVGGTGGRQQALDLHPGLALVFWIPLPVQGSHQKREWGGCMLLFSFAGGRWA